MSYMSYHGLGSVVASSELAEVARRAGIPVDVMLAIKAIESRGNTRATRFEPHVFHRRTGNRYVGAVPGQPGEVSRVRAHTDRAAFEHARRFDEAEAIRSTSWGAFQVLGGHLLRLYPDAHVSAFDSNPSRVGAEMVVSWFDANPRARAAAQTGDIAELARRYNGSDHWRDRVTAELARIRREGVVVAQSAADIAVPIAGVAAVVLAAGFAGWAAWRYR